MAEEQQTINFPNLAGGINQGVPRDQMAVNQTPSSQNMVVIDGIVQKRTGYAANAGTKPATPTTPFLGGHHYGDGFSGKKRMWAVTGNATGGKAWEKELLGGNWADKTNSMQIQTGADQYMTFAECVEFNDYKNYLFLCQNHTEPLTALNGTVNSDESIVWYANAPDGNLTALAGADGYNDSNTKHRAKQVIAFESCVFLLNTYEETSTGVYTPLPYRVRFSNPHEFKLADDWNPSASGSLAGYWDAREGLGAIVQGALLRGKLMLYLQEAIYSCVTNDSVTAPFVFFPRITDKGLYGPRLLISANDAHYFVGTDREIYEYTGGIGTEPIGDKILTSFFSDMNNAASGNYLIRRRAFMVHFRDIKAIGLFQPTSGSHPSVMYMYYYRDRKWDKVVLPATKYLTGWGEWQSPAGSSVQNMPIFGDETGDIFNWDYATLTDDSTLVDAWIHTQDIIVDVGQEQTSGDVWFEADGDGAASNCKVSISYDGGGTFVQEQTVTIGTTWKSYKVTLPVTGYQIRLKFKNNVATHKLRLGRVRMDLHSAGEVS